MLWRKTWTEIDVEQFARILAEKKAFVINVRVPHAADIPGTSAYIPYNEIDGNAKLPREKDREIVVYCRSGGCSRVAAATLVKLGHTNVKEFSGGLLAWEASRRSVATHK